MKKNRMMRLASGLLVAVLATTSVISGTYAKYVTSAESTDKARVAKWGVEITGAADMFSDKYDKEDAAYSLTAESVISAGDVDGYEKVVAPGTTGALTNFAITGEPEVATRVTYTVETFDIDNWKVDGSDYIPLVITVTNGTDTVEVNGLDSATDTEAEFEAAVKAAIENDLFKSDYEPNEDLSGKNGERLVISWNWPFSTSTENDEKDTSLGNASSLATVDIKVKCTVTQVN